MTDGTVAVFDHPDPVTGGLVRHYLLLGEAIKLMHEPWGWTDCWYADLVDIRKVDAVTIEVADLCVDIVIEGVGPTYRIIDFDDLADGIAAGEVDAKALCEPLRRLQTFLDAHLHGGRDFPPAYIAPFLPNANQQGT